MSVSIEQKSPQYEDWQSLDYEYLLRLKQSYPTLKLLAADNGPLIISFLYYNSSRSTGAPWRNPIWSPVWMTIFISYGRYMARRSTRRAPSVIWMIGVRELTLPAQILHGAERRAGVRFDTCN
ncbi:DUF3375 domain-containing protein [Candidatus Vondammii sp. HM_W22]|uniref:DUF3375 domain-containing protein n=1 Tax=Candidatus Vondammii sp. HM_W22 TaxID=2687299 RepID=UPI001F1341D0|nr:DUF3375 domain-containing protein [Candidatus Vondammii sp. HM_W22]